ncbi:MAG TPA: HAMP domain-containing sensor histidine kinase, partial [Blastocatellia bacterium]|nr:HAMP domain-containing sensor histidine kinase [Blastocatellia bacterium]
LRQRRSAEEYREVIESSLRDASRLSALADDLLLLARADSNGLSMEMKEVSVSDVVGTVHRQLLPLAEAHRIRFSFENESECLAYGDQFRLNQAFRNIAENALKYTPSGGSVTMTVTPVGHLIRTDVEDTGIGISEAELAKIFGRFYRVDHARSRGDGGAGLGLAICDHIIRAHDGRIEVASAHGQGARFSVYLPSARALDEDGA